MSLKYHKIQTIFKRDPTTKHKTLLYGEFSTPEFQYLADNDWEFTEKVDGTNIRVLINPHREYDREWIEFRGRTDQSQIPPHLFTVLEEMFMSDIQRDAIYNAFPDGGCLYGEGYGPKIQNGGENYRKAPSFVLFDVKIDNWWLKREDVEDIASKLLIDAVPVIGQGTLWDMVDRATQGFPSRWGRFTAEGIVARPFNDLRTRDGHRIITKIKHRDFGD